MLSRITIRTVCWDLSLRYSITKRRSLLELFARTTPTITCSGYRPSPLNQSSSDSVSHCKSVRDVMDVTVKPTLKNAFNQSDIDPTPATVDPSTSNTNTEDTATLVTDSIETEIEKQDMGWCGTTGPIPSRKRKKFPFKTKKGKKLDNHPKKIQKFENDLRFDETTYYFENGLRMVTPYVYVFATHIKGRWLGRPLLDVFREEFRMETPEYYEMAIKKGLITINGDKVSADKILVNNEFMRSMVHRHEPPVSGEPLEIIKADEEYVVVNKPTSIPVHPCGKYRHNTIIFILGKDYGLTGLHTVHRLDRLTSGLLIFARTREVSQRLDAYVRERKLTKVYLCKVNGEFPSELVECSQPIHTVSHKIGVCVVRPDGKQCKTNFQRLSYDGATSIVQCTPHTGRMHQIRVHLQYLGFPIINDPLYNNTVWGPQLGKGGGIPHGEENLLTELIKQHTAELQTQVIDDPANFIQSTRQQLVPSPPNGAGAAKTREGATTFGVPNDPGQTDDLPKADSNNREPDPEQAPVDISPNANDTSCFDEATVPAPGRPGSSASPDVANCGHTSGKDPSMSDTEQVEGCQSESVTVSASEPASGECRETDLHRLVKSVCRECKLKLRDPEPGEMIMYLHALSYKGPDFEFSTTVPQWAAEHIQRTSLNEGMKDRQADGNA